jgi:predicted RNA-binding Zn-ribbon protein involved in translation (DUF1610 family)
VTVKLLETVSAGALVLIALLLMLVISRLARLEKALGTQQSSDASPETSASVEEATGATPDEEAAPIASTESTADGEEGPYERDGRWWFRRGEEELVFDERTETWVSPDDTPESDSTPSGELPAEVAAVHPLDEPRPTPTTTETPVVVPAQMQEPATESPAVVGAGSVEPVGEPPIETEPEPRAITATEEAGQPAGAATHWKCPNCGVVNGSTATSCRMCFAARP